MLTVPDCPVGSNRFPETPDPLKVKLPPGGVGVTRAVRLTGLPPVHTLVFAVVMEALDVTSISKVAWVATQLPME